MSEGALLLKRSRAVEGGITVFMSIVYLSLVIFSCSIIEVTRMNIAKVQAERSMISASASVLGAYDTYLKEQYGLFARAIDYSDLAYIEGSSSQGGLAQVGGSGLSNKMSGDFRYYINEHIHNDPDQLRQSLLDVALFDHSKASYWQLVKLELQTINVDTRQKLVDSTPESMAYVKEEMLTYMDLRVPMLLLAPFLKKIDAFEKVGKTGDFIKEKNQIVEEVSEIEGGFNDLYRLIEGLEVDTTSGKMTLVGEQSDTKYVKKLVGDASKVLYDQGYIEAGISEGLEKEVDILKTSIDDYSKAVMASKGMIVSLIDSYEDYEDLQDKIDDYEDDADDYEDVIDDLNDDVKVLWGKIAKLDATTTEGQSTISKHNSSIQKIKESILGSQKQLDSVEAKIHKLENRANDLEDDMDDDLKDLTAGYREAEKSIAFIEGLVKGSDSYMAVNQDVVTSIERIQGQLGGVEQKIDGFLSQSEKEALQLMDNAYSQGVDEMEVIKASYGANASGSYNAVNNLDYMLVEVKGNIALLERVKGEVSALRTYYDAYRGCLDIVGINEYSYSSSPTSNKLTSAKIDRFELSSSFSNQQGDMLARCLNIADTMKGYSRKLYFDYTMYNQGESGEREKATGIVSKLKGIVSSFDFTKVFEDIPPADIELLEAYPSSIMANSRSSTTSGKSNMNLDYEESGSEEQFFDTTSVMGGMSGLALDFREQIFLNEYAIGMFCAYPDKDDDSQLTLSGYAKSGHVLDTEVEYILTGNPNANDALRQVMLMIFGMRVVCNMMHLLTDGAKRTRIIQLANAIAGWWTMGAGAIIVGVLITLLWASAESMVDLVMLMNNRKVPLIKVGSAWYTDMDGDMSDLVEFGAQMAEKAAGKVIDVASGEVSRIITQSSSLISEETSRFYTEEVGRIYEDGSKILEARADAMESQYYIGVDDYLEYCERGQSSKWRASNYFVGGSGESALLSSIINDLAVEIASDTSRHHLIEAKTKVMSKYQTLIRDKKSQDLLDWTLDFDHKIVDYAKEVNGEIQAYADQGKEAAGDLIHQKSEAFMEKMASESKGKLPDIDGEGHKRAGVKLEEVVPNLGYHDYLRLFMLIDHKGLDERVARMLDMIDLNLAYAHPDKGSDGKQVRRLSTYVTGVKAEGNFEMSAGLFLIPFVRYRDQTKDRNYSYKVQVVNSYE